MPGFLLHLGATVMCAHGGQAQPTAVQPRVLVSGQPVVTLAAPYVVAGCALPPPPAANGPCVTAQFIDGRDPGLRRGIAGTADGQPGDLRAHRHAVDRRRDAAPGDGNVRALMNIDFPFQIDGRGRTAAATDDDHIRDMIEQLLFTNPGERVNRPGFGSGLLQMVFQPNSTELAAALQFTLQGSLQQWLGDLIQLQAVQVDQSGQHAAGDWCNMSCAASSRASCAVLAGDLRWRRNTSARSEQRRAQVWRLSMPTAIHS